MHTIRLLGPWTAQVGELPPQRYHADDGLGGVLRLHAAAFAAKPQPVVLQRPFNRPSGLDDVKDVRLNLQCNQACRIELNGSPLATHAIGDWQCSVLPHLQLRNQLRVYFTLDDGPSGEPVVHDVRLLIILN